MLDPLACFLQCLCHKNQSSKGLSHAHLISKDPSTTFVGLLMLLVAGDDMEIPSPSQRQCFS